ncbi:MAG: DUF4202 family protein [Xanthomonadaceae bacterium]|nr:DUF4202 family protein [Xanthomonadaceae bacterium]
MSETVEKRHLVYFPQVKEYVDHSFAAVNNRIVPLHLERTAAWLIKLCPEVDESLLIAGIAHDIERAFREEVVYQKMFHSDNGFLDDTFLDYHQQRSAKIITDYLKTLNCPTALSEKVFHLVAHHETGGDIETDLLKDADSLSFFQTNIDFFVTVKVKESSVDKVKNKFTWMFERISNPKAREFCLPLYEDAMARLANLKTDVNQ